MTKKPTPPKRIWVNGVEYSSVTQAAFALKVRRTRLSQLLKNADPRKPNEVWISNFGNHVPKKIKEARPVIHRKPREEKPDFRKGKPSFKRKRKVDEE